MHLLNAFSIDNSAAPICIFHIESVLERLKNVHRLLLQDTRITIFNSYYVSITFKAAKSVPFDHLFLEIVFLIFNNTVI